ncbi:MAG: hypothetical protein IJ997_01405 [Mycoplasmataceae bacterium]|nr:hypothetical protein [Mycoplasmataceae bacterium]
MELKIYFEEIKPEYLAYIDICKEKALNDEVYYSTLLKEMSEGFINYFIEKEEDDEEEIKIRDLLDYQIKLMESMNFNNDVIVKRLNKIFNILVKQKHKDNVLNDGPCVYLTPSQPELSAPSAVPSVIHPNNDNITINNDSRITYNDGRITNNDERITYNDGRIASNNGRITSNDERITNSVSSNETKQSKFHYRKIRHLNEQIEEQSEPSDEEQSELSDEEQSEEEIILNLQRSNNNEQSDN